MTSENRLPRGQNAPFAHGFRRSAEPDVEVPLKENKVKIRLQQDACAKHERPLNSHVVDTAHLSLAPRPQIVRGFCWAETTLE